MNSEVDRLSRVDIVRRRQLPENYQEELIPQALYVIRAAAHRDEAIHLALEALEPDKLQPLKDAQDVDSFREALIEAFGHGQSVQIVGAALGKLGNAIDLLNRKEDGKIGGYYPNPEFVSQVYDVRVKASEILGQLKSDITSEVEGEAFLVAIS